MRERDFVWPWTMKDEREHNGKHEAEGSEKEDGENGRTMSRCAARSEAGGKMSGRAERGEEGSTGEKEGRRAGEREYRPALHVTRLSMLENEHFL